MSRKRGLGVNVYMGERLFTGVRQHVEVEGQKNESGLKNMRLNSICCCTTFTLSTHKLVTGFYLKASSNICTISFFDHDTMLLHYRHALLMFMTLTMPRKGAVTSVSQKKVFSVHEK